MAKLTAGGRTEVARASKVYPGVGESEGYTTTYTYALMSDGKTLRKVRVVWQGRVLRAGVWKLATRWVYPTEREAWLAVFDRAGFSEVTK